MAKAKTLSELRDEMVDREAIRDCLHRYSRAIDRAELDMLRTVYWPDAVDDHSGFKGTVEELIAWAQPQLQHMENCMHMLGNIFMRIDGAVAMVESYFWSVLVLKEAPMRETVVVGRYLDRFERRDDEWRIAGRVVTHDWFRQYEDGPNWSAGLFGTRDLERGGFMPRDKSYSWLGLV